MYQYQYSLLAEQWSNAKNKNKKKLKQLYEAWSQELTSRMKYNIQDIFPTLYFGKAHLSLVYGRYLVCILTYLPRFKKLWQFEVKEQFLSRTHVRFVNSSNLLFRDLIFDNQLAWEYISLRLCSPQGGTIPKTNEIVKNICSCHNFFPLSSVQIIIIPACCLLCVL